MNTRRPGTAKKNRSVPVAVNVTSQPTPTTLPPLNLEPTPPPAPTKRAVAAKVVAAPVKALRQPVHAWPEDRRRRLMWWLVIGGASVVMIGWVAVLRWEMAGGRSTNLFSDAWRMLRSFNLTGTKNSTAAEQEIRSLDTQVFPQFQR